MRLTINLATRGRPELLVPTIEKTLENVRDLNTTLMVSVDDDDEATISALSSCPFLSGNKFYLSTAPREDSLGAKYNRCLSLPWVKADVYLAMVDYAPHVTPGFDERILEATESFPDGIGVVYNHLANLSFSGINAVTHRMAELMGGIYPEHFPYWWIDHWLDDVARMIGRIAFADVAIDTSRRPGTQSKRDLLFWAEFFDRTWPLRERTALSIVERREFVSPPWLKSLLVRNFPSERLRSRAVNAAAVREHAGTDNAVDDERHARLREAARQLVGDIAVTSWPTAVPLRHPQSVVIATPSHSHWVALEHRDSALDTQHLLDLYGVPCRFVSVGGNGLAALVRNKLATAYRADFDDFENLFYVDDDLGWDPGKVLEYVSRSEPVIVGCYPRKTDPREPPQFAVDFLLDEQGRAIAKDGLLRVGSIGAAGFMRVKRWVVDRIAEEYGTFADRTTDKPFADHYLNLFQDGPDANREWNGEDVTFIRRCISLNIDVWCDPNAEFGHRGSYLWKGKLADRLEIVDDP
jgi:hypothetical protein